MTVRLMDGQVLSGTPLEIVQSMQALSGRFNQHRSTDEYIAQVVEWTLQGMGIELSPTGGTTDERAASLMDQMIVAKLAEEVLLC